MKINYYEILELKKCIFLLFICLFFCSISIIARVNKVSIDNSSSCKRTAGVLKENFSRFFSSLSDTVPGQDKKEKSLGWEILFDGENIDKWRGKDSNAVPEGWVIEKGLLFLNKKGSGDIFTRKQYGNFELVLDFNLTVNANSGIKYFVGNLKNIKTGEIAFNGIEYQIIDDYNHPEVKDHKHDLGATASCYLLYAPKNTSLKPAGQWNHVRIIAIGKHVEHWLNDVKVLQYERGSSDFLKRKAITKFKDYENYGELLQGHILLTDHIDKVYFRNIKIKRL
ncbi:MAG: DUF1080 domain-containing protein [Segetibacter sp.]